MGQIKSMKVRNLRSFPSETDFFDIKKVNLLVGKNSSGKSSFLRLFPLLRQSFEESTTGPILWFGKYVDFGDFESAFNKNLKKTSEKVIYFDFQLDVDVDVDSDVYYLNSQTGEWPEKILGNRNKSNQLSLPVQVSLGVRYEDGGTKACYFSIQVGSSLIEVESTPYGGEASFKALSLKNNTLLESSKDLMIFEDEFFSQIFERRESTSRDGGYFYTRSSGLPSDMADGLVTYISRIFSMKNNKRNINKILKVFSLASKDDVWKALKSFNIDSGRLLNEKELMDHLEDVYLFVLSYNYNLIASSVNKELKDFYTSVKYLGPVRATAERFYRYQDLRVNEIDHMGANLPMVISSIPAYLRTDLVKWMKENFGFTLTLKTSGSHLALMIKEENDTDEYNISDMGFGYSQLLPIVVSIWMQISDRKLNYKFSLRGKEQAKIIVIEQPELHLHPEMQYRFAQAIVKIVSISENLNLRFIFETHSKHMIDAFGHAIQDGKLSSDVINIALFEKSDDKCTHLKTSGFDEDGYLENWPVGFLSP